MDWLAKLWYEKLFDVILLLFASGGVITLLIVAVKSFAKIGKTPKITNDNGKWSVTLIDSEGVSKEVGRDEFANILAEKDAKIKNLTERLEEVQTRLALLEFDLQKSKVIIDYQKQHAVPLSEHTVFFNLKRNIEGGVYLDCDTSEPLIKIKQEIAKIYIEDCKMSVFYERLREYVLSFETLTNDNDCLLKLYGIITNLYDWIDEYSNKAMNHKVTLSDGRTFYGIPKSFITKFNEWHNPHVEIVVKKIKEVLYNEFYGTWQLKLIVILDHIDTAFYLTVQDAEKTIQSVNGGVEKDIQNKLNSI